MAPPDEKPPKPILNPLGTPPGTSQRERLEREQAEMRERQQKEKPLYPPLDTEQKEWDGQALMLMGGCIAAGAVILFLVIYFFLF